MAQTELKLMRLGGDVVCDSELFEHLLDMAEILDMARRGTPYEPKVLARIGRQINQLRRRYDTIVTLYYADAWDPDDNEDYPHSNDSTV